jgi:excinuclease UvrABC nuclease subunit
MTTVYQCFDADDNLLYVGIATSWPSRFLAHKHGSSWFASVARLELEHYDSREDARRREKELVQTTAPIHNIRLREDLVNVTVTITRRQYDAIHAAAVALGISKSALLRKVVDEFLGFDKATIDPRESEQEVA